MTSHSMPSPLHTVSLEDRRAAIREGMRDAANDPLLGIIALEARWHLALAPLEPGSERISRYLRLLESQAQDDVYLPSSNDRTPDDVVYSDTLRHSQLYQTAVAKLMTRNVRRRVDALQEPATSVPSDQSVQEAVDLSEADEPNSAESTSTTDDEETLEERHERIVHTYMSTHLSQSISLHRDSLSECDRPTDRVAIQEALDTCEEAQEMLQERRPSLLSSRLATAESNHRDSSMSDV